jgi:hypothetical protein
MRRLGWVRVRTAHGARPPKPTVASPPQRAAPPPGSHGCLGTPARTEQAGCWVRRGCWLGMRLLPCPTIYTPPLPLTHPERLLPFATSAPAPSSSNSSPHAWREGVRGGRACGLGRGRAGVHSGGRAGRAGVRGGRGCADGSVRALPGLKWRQSLTESERLETSSYLAVEVR